MHIKETFFRQKVYHYFKIYKSYEKHFRSTGRSIHSEGRCQSFWEGNNNQGSYEQEKTTYF